MAGSFWMWFFGVWLGLGAVTWTVFVAMKLRIEERDQCHQSRWPVSSKFGSAGLANVGGQRPKEARVRQASLS